MTLLELFAAVLPDKLARADELDRALSDALHDQEGHEAPILVQVFSAVGTWIGAAMLAMIFFALELYEVEAVALVLGLGLFAGAVALSRLARRSLAMTQLIWALGLGGHGLVAGVMLENNAADTTVAAVLLVQATASLFLVRVPSFALAAAVCAVGFGTWLAATLQLPLYPLWVALPVAALATAAWIFESRWAARLGRSWAALAYGLPLGVAGPLTLVGLDDEGMGLVAQGPGTTIASVAMVGLIGVVLVWAKREAEAKGEVLETRVHVFGVTAIIAALAARHVPGLSLGLLWLLVAHLRRSPALQGLASLQLAGFLFFFYYQLETTLLLKSLWVTSTGAVLLLGAFLGRPRPAADATKAGEAKEGRRSRWIPALILVALTTTLIAVPSALKQRVLATGERVLLPLAPVDPRSLMQGDYMVLRYALEEELRTKLDAPMFGLPDAEQLPRHGQLVIALDELGVGHFVRVHEGEALGPDEHLLEYRVRSSFGGELRIGGESFLFEEGSAEVYAEAAYGELILAADGEAILVGLRDGDRAPLGSPLH